MNEDYLHLVYFVVLSRAVGAGIHAGTVDVANMGGESERTHPKTQEIPSLAADPIQLNI